MGQGTIRGIESLGLSVIRIIEEEALKENTAQVRTILPTEVAAYLLNEKRQTIIDIEKRQQVSVIIVPSAHFLTPQYEVERIRISDLTEKDEKLASYKLAVNPDIAIQAANNQPIQKPHQEPVLKVMPMDELPAPQKTSKTEISKPNEPGLLKKLFTFLFEKKAKAAITSSTSEDPRRTRSFDRTRKPPYRAKGRYHHRDRDHRDHHHRRDRSKTYQSHSQRPHGQHENKHSRDLHHPSEEQKKWNETHQESLQQSGPVQPPVSPPIQTSLQKPLETAPDAPLLLTQQDQNIPHQTSTTGDERRKKHNHYRPYRHKYNKHQPKRQQHTEPHRQSSEGEDQYSSHKKEDENGEGSS